MRPAWLAKLVKLPLAWLPIRVLGDRLDPAARAGFERAMSLANERIDAADLLGRPPDRAESIHLLIRAADALE
ncbi:MAG TPA: hypothetical protein VFG23_11820, partial [Polyangia bacterium]|nr:hypothetical protein [Polyangia bacterium]